MKPPLFFGTPPYRNTITVLCEEGKRALGLALGRRITGRLCYRIRLVVFSESAFVPLVCVTKPALGLEANESCAKLGSLGYD